MKPFDLRVRMLLAALLPLVLTSTLLALFFMSARFDDLRATYTVQTRTLARQLALASEYGLFSGNEAQLQALAAGALREPDVYWVGVFDSHGRQLASSGDAGAASPLRIGARERHHVDAARALDWLAQPVFGSAVTLDDMYEGAAAQPGSAPVLLGQVQVAFSRQALNDRWRDMLLLGGLIGLLGLVFGLGLALWLSRGVLHPVMRVTRLIDRIGSGDFAPVQAARAELQPSDPLHDLQLNLHRMAERLALTQDDLARQVQQATVALQARTDEAEQATLAKSRFLAAASHDLRQPIHALGMFVARLGQLAHDAQTGQLVTQLQTSIRALQMLLDGLLDISRLQTQEIPVKEQAFAVADLLDQLQRDMAPAAHDKGLTLRICPSALWVTSDAALLYRILLNLTSNALRYTAQGSVLVTARRSGNGTQVLLQVWDSGLGIAPEHQQRVFDEFYQVANSGRDRRKGMGLGLNIVQRTAALLGHPLQMRSALGCGTRFTLCLPLAAANHALSATWLQPGSDSPTASDLQQVCVQVIEDDDLVRLALSALLDGWDMQVYAADGLAQAVAQIEAGCRPTLIISDYRLQDEQDGISVIAHLRTLLGQATPACLISGDTGVSLAQAAQAAGLTLLHKPVAPAKMRSLLRRLLQPSPV